METMIVTSPQQFRSTDLEEHHQTLNSYYMTLRGGIGNAGSKAGFDLKPALLPAFPTSPLRVT